MLQPAAKTGKHVKLRSTHGCKCGFGSLCIPAASRSRCLKQLHLVSIFLCVLSRAFRLVLGAEIDIDMAVQDAQRKICYVQLGSSGDHLSWREENQ